MSGEEQGEEEIEETGPLEVKVINPPQEKSIETSYEEPDPWEFTKMTEEDIKEAEESRNA